MLYVEIRKNFEVRRGNFFISLPSDQKTLGKLVCLPSAKKKHSANSLVCRVLKKHSANKLFAECLFFVECIFFDTRQMACLPSARCNALGKPLGTRQMWVFL